MKIKQFEEIKSWIKAKEFTIKIFRLFENKRNNVFKIQIQRASLSIMNNIAEGFERNTNKEFKQFLYIAKGSAGEVRSMLHLAKDLKMINDKEYNELSEDSLAIARMISGFIKVL